MTERRRAALAAGLAATLLGALACAPRAGGLQLVSYANPRAPEPFELRFDRSAWYRDAAGDTHISGYAATGRDADLILQYFHAHVYWRPRPGKTPDDASSIDATLRYVVQTDTGVLVYRGSGYVYLDSRRRGLDARFESGRLQLDRWFGEAPDVLGNVQVSGRLRPQADEGLALDIRRELDRVATGATVTDGRE